MKTSINRLTLSHLSIKQRLPLLIFILLFTIIVIFSWISYLGVKKATLEIGRDRLSTLTNQLSGMFQQSFGVLTATAHNATVQPAVKNFLRTGGKESREDALKAIEGVKRDTQSVDIELLDVHRATLLRSVKSEVMLNLNIDSVLLPAASRQDYAAVGKIFVVNDTMYYPIVATVGDGERPIGYLVQWHMLLATPQAIEQLAQLIGSDAKLYFGNDDGKFWTDMMRPITMPAINTTDSNAVLQYKSRTGDPLLAAARQVPNTHWLVRVEFSQEKVMAATTLFVRWVIVIGIILAAIGSFVAWLMSRNITQPLKKLTAAASVIAEGDYSNAVDINRNDELGKLAEAFNIMVVEVRNAQHDLEKKVKDRTAELESANKELEAFSYSVSHDLHAPLRIIDGYAAILGQRSAGALDDEGNKILNHIRLKAKRMGTLIDELLNLSYLGRKELSMELVDMDATVHATMKEQLLLAVKPVEFNIKKLPPAMCDNTLIRQVWSNLISNAIKYSARNDKACIEIASRSDGDYITYVIKDNGVGFDMKYAGKLFGVFQRLHGIKEFEGSGVGLALVQRVIKKHGGKVWAEAEEGKGATFYFSLPVTPAAQ